MTTREMIAAAMKAQLEGTRAEALVEQEAAHLAAVIEQVAELRVAPAKITVKQAEWLLRQQQIESENAFLAVDDVGKVQAQNAIRAYAQAAGKVLEKAIGAAIP